jgi:dynamin 1-like protein
MLNLLNECLKPTNNMVKNLVIVQNSYINTYHPDFMGGANSIFSLFEPFQDVKDDLASMKRVKVEKIEEVRNDGIRDNDLSQNSMTDMAQNDKDEEVVNTVRMR